eukprot:4955734-Pleurochrysis_carterae.AAC.1
MKAARLNAAGLRLCHNTGTTGCIHSPHSNNTSAQYGMLPFASARLRSRHMVSNSNWRPAICPLSPVTPSSARWAWSSRMVLTVALS